MSIDVMVLGAMLRLARRRKGADGGALALRVGVSEAAVRAVLRRLERCALVDRIDGQAPRGAHSLVPDEPRALLGGIHELAEAVRELDPGHVELEPLGDPGITGLEARERSLAGGVVDEEYPPVDLREGGLHFIDQRAKVACLLLLGGAGRLL